MSGKSLFTNIFKKNIQKVKDKNQYSKFADDIGPLKGEVFIQKYDLTNGKVENDYIENALTHFSKTSIIRLISQGNSPEVGGVIDPEDYKVAKMRFGNSTSGSSSNLQFYYYDIETAAIRDNPSPPANIDRVNNPLNLEASNSDHYEYDSVTNFGTIKTDITGEKGPSPGTVVLKLKDQNGNLVQTMTFGFTTGYIKTGTTPSQNTLEDSNTIIASTDTTQSLNNIFFYDENDDTWKFNILIEEGNSNYLTDSFSGNLNGKIEVNYTIGQFNVINSIVPVNGTNSGSGTTFLSRYGSESNIDYYTIGSNLTYYNTKQEAGSAPPVRINDFSIDFAISMAGEQGNGSGSVVYNEAFLMTQNDKMFSVIDLLNDGKEFTKDNTSAYFITWRVSAPLS